MPLPYDSPSSGDPFTRKAQDRAYAGETDAVRRFLQNLVFEQAKDVKGLAYGLTVDPLNQMGRAIKEKKFFVKATPEEDERATRGLALLGSLAVGGPAGKIAGKLLPGRALLGKALTGAAMGATDAGIRTGGDPAATLGGAAFGGALGGALGKMGQAPGGLNINNPLEPTGRTLRELGESGNAIADAIDRMQNRANVNAGTAVHAFTEAGLDRLNPADDAALGLALRGRLAPDALSPAAKRVYDVADAQRRAVAQRATERNLQVMTHAGEKKPFLARKDYFPQATPEISQLRSGPIRDEAIANSVAMGHYPNREAATKALDSWLEFADSGGRSDTGELYANLLAKRYNTTVDRARGMMIRKLEKPQISRNPNLERAREFDFEFYDPSPKRVLARYVENSEKRLAEVEHLGQDFEKLGGYLGGLGGRDRELARYLIQTAVGRKGGDTRLSGILGAGRQLSTMKLSPTSGIKNLGQTVNTGLVTDLGSTMGGIKDAFTQRGRDFAEQAGATTEGALRHSQHMVGAESNFLRRYLKSIGFTFTEKFNRVVSSNAGRRYAEKMVRRLQRNPGDEFAMNELRKLQLDPESIGPQTMLSPQEQRIAGQAVTNRSQFNSTPMDLPPTIQDSPITWSAAQYKTYPYQQLQMLRAETVDRMLSGQPGDKLRAARNIAGLGILAPAAGEVINDAVEGVKQTGREGFLAATGQGQPGALGRILAAGTGQTRKEAPWSPERYVTNALAPGAIGILSDVGGALQNNPTEYLAGPTIGTAANLGSRVYRAANREEGPTNSDLRYLYRQIPTVGPLTVDAAVPKKEPKTKPRNKRKAKKERK